MSIIYKSYTIVGPFQNRPISNLRCSPIGVVPKKTGGWRLITGSRHVSGCYLPYDDWTSIARAFGLINL